MIDFSSRYKQSVSGELSDPKIGQQHSIKGSSRCDAEEEEKDNYGSILCSYAQKGLSQNILLKDKWHNIVVIPRDALFFRTPMYLKLITLPLSSIHQHRPSTFILLLHQ